MYIRGECLAGGLLYCCSSIWFVFHEKGAIVLLLERTRQGDADVIGRYDIFVKMVQHVIDFV